MDMTETPSPSEEDGKQSGTLEGSDSMRSTADQAKERETEMEESGEENAG
jgi:hypothetical protein